MPAQTLLYYPTFAIPSEQWLKDAILYWDKVGSIVPERFQKELVEESPVIRDLLQSELYRFFDPRQASENVVMGTPFIADMTSRLDSDQFCFEMEKQDSNEYMNIAIEKMNYDCWKLLLKRGLTQTEKYNKTGWIPVKKPAAIIYMGLLAQYIADNDYNYVRASTDRAEYENAIYRGNASDGVMGLHIALKGLIPRVAEDTPLNRVIHFRNDHYSDLLRFRMALDKIQMELKNCSDNINLCKQIVAYYQDDIELGLAQIKRSMDEYKIRSALGTMRALFNLKTPAVIGAAIGVGAMSNGSSLSDALVPSVLLFAAGACVELAQCLIDIEDKKRLANEQPYSYLYYAQTESII